MEEKKIGLVLGGHQVLNTKSDDIKNKKPKMQAKNNLKTLKRFQT
jgi:hypothetical protein